MSEVTEKRDELAEKFDAIKFSENIVTWGDLAKEAVGHEDAHAVFYLPQPIERHNKQFNAMSMVKLKNGQRVSILTRLDELTGRPEYCMSEDIMAQFVKE